MFFKYKIYSAMVFGLLSLALVGTLQAKDDEYIPWTVDIAGLPPGKCTITELATSLEGARQWARDYAGWVNLYSVNEHPSKIVFNYYDGLLKTKLTRTFYKDMATCKLERKD